MNLFVVVWGFIKSHLIASIVVGTVLVGVAVATPIILLNQSSDPKPKEDIKEEVNEDQKNNEQEPIVCDEGFALNEDNICEIIKEDDSEQKPVDNSNKDNKPKEDNKTNQGSTTTKEEDKPKEETTTPKADPLKKYCDNRIAGYSIKDGICVDLYPDDQCNYSGTCFGGGHPDEELSDYNDKSTYPGGKEEYDKAVANWEAWVTAKAKSICTSRGYGWTDALNKTFGNCTW